MKTMTVRTVFAISTSIRSSSVPSGAINEGCAVGVWFEAVGDALEEELKS